jgi:hypothetical protein
VLKGVKDVQGGGILVVAACRPFGCHAPREYTALLQSDTTVVIHLRQGQKSMNFKKLEAQMSFRWSM